MNKPLAEMTREELQAMVERMQKQAQNKLTLKVSGKGAVSLYGLGRFPVTLYAEQWNRVIALVKEGTVEAFIRDNHANLSFKE